MTHYSPSGKAHRALACLASGDMTPAQLRHAALPDATANHRRKFFYVCSSMEHDGLIRRLGPDYAITPKGRDLLSKLSAISDPFPGVVTSCRVFRERAEVEA